MSFWDQERKEVIEAVLEELNAPRADPECGAACMLLLSHLLRPGARRLTRR